MAVFRLSSKVISRANGQSVVASIAYRTAELLYDQKLKVEFDYTKKQGVDYTEIMLPEGAPEWASDRETLWNKVEQTEIRKDAQLAREVQLSLPVELTNAQKIALTREFVQENFVDKGMIADIALHHLDGENPHAHVVLTMRELQADGFGQKVRDWNQKSLLLEWREAWAVTQNRHLAMAGHDLHVDHRSYEDQGINLLSQDISLSAHHVKSKEDLAQAKADLLAIQRENGEKIIKDPTIVLKAMTHYQSTFTLNDIDRFIDKRTADAEQFQAARAKVLSCPELVKIGLDSRHVERYTSFDMLQSEQNLFKLSDQLKAREGHRVSDHAIKQALALRPTLREDQKAAIEHLVSKGDIKVLASGAGMGKSYLMSAAREIWESQGYRVRGAALSGITAENLSKDTGIEESRTVASWQHRWARGENLLSRRDILVVEEASMLGTRQFEALQEQVERHGAKIIPLGDDEQMQSIEGGGAFRGICEHVGFVSLDTVVRQKVAWQREASKEFASGDGAIDAVRRYAEHGCIRMTDTHDDAIYQAVSDALQAKANDPNQSVLLMAHTRRDVATLNMLVRERRQADGAINQGIAFDLVRGKRELSDGDRIMFLRNDPAMQVFNGTLGTIERINPNGHILIETDSGQSVAFNVHDYNELEYGYATTVHKAAGVTVDRAFAVASRGYDRHLTYEAMTRHRESVTLYAGRDQFKDDRALAYTLTRENKKDLIVDYAVRRDIDSEGYNKSHQIDALKASSRMEPTLIETRSKEADLKVEQQHTEQARSTLSHESEIAPQRTTPQDQMAQYMERFAKREQAIEAYANSVSDQSQKPIEVYESRLRSDHDQAIGIYRGVDQVGDTHIAKIETSDKILLVEVQADMAKTLEKQQQEPVAINGRFRSQSLQVGENIQTHTQAAQTIKQDSMEAHRQEQIMRANQALQAQALNNSLNQEKSKSQKLSHSIERGGLSL